jgi:hypothetical protein
MSKTLTLTAKVLVALVVTSACAGSHSGAPPVVAGGGVQLSIPSGWADMAPFSKSVPAKSEYAVGVISRQTIDGFAPNFNVFVRTPEVLDWAAGDGISEPHASEIARYDRSVLSKLGRQEVTYVTDSRLAAEQASDFSTKRTLETCACVIRQTWITVAHAGLVYTAIFTTADKSSKAMAATLESLRGTWRWTAKGTPTPTPQLTGGVFSAADTLLTVADLPDAFQVVQGAPSIDIPGGASQEFEAGSRKRLLMSVAVVWPDESTAEAYRARLAKPIADLEFAELRIDPKAKAFLAQSVMFGGVGSDHGMAFVWFRIVWRTGLTVSEVLAQATNGNFEQTEVVSLALKQAAHTRFAAIPGNGSAANPPSATASPSAGATLYFFAPEPGSKVGGTVQVQAGPDSITLTAKVDGLSPGGSYIVDADPLPCLIFTLGPSQSFAKPLTADAGGKGRIVWSVPSGMAGNVTVQRLTDAGTYAVLACADLK